MLDFIIVGNGIAGSILAHELLKKGKSLKIISNSSLPSSSSVAGGMFNPVTGKYLAKTWLANDLYPFLHSYYGDLELELGIKFFHPCGVFRPFSNLENKTNFINQIEKHSLQDYVNVDELFYDENIKAAFGGIHIKNSGWVNVPLLIAKFREIYFNHIIDAQFDHQLLIINEDFVDYQDLKAKHIIFAEGWNVFHNPYFNNLPFNPVKGETLVVESSSYEVKPIINQGKWVINLGNNMLRIGSTYSWHELDFESTEIGKIQILETASKFFKTTFNIINQEAGVRPATKDRRPIIGTHPNHHNLHIFNGFGTKGVSLIPYFTHQFIDFLLENKHLQLEANINRYYALYS